MRKYIVLITAMALMSGCATIKRSEPTSYCTVLDYKPLIEEGFFVTEAPSVNFDYKGLCSISAVSVSGYRKVKGEKSFKNEENEKIYYALGSGSRTEYESCDVKRAIQEIIQKLKDVGADGIINLRYEFIPSSATEYSKIVVSGMAIKRL